MRVFKQFSCLSLSLLLLMSSHLLAATLSRGTVRINHHQFHVEVATTAAEAEHGLSGRLQLPDDAGMYFLFDKPDKRYFWMKEMNFPLDIIWIRRGVVVGISSDLPTPESETAKLKIYPSVEDADAVLEINAGKAALYNFKVGDKVVFVRASE